MSHGSNPLIMESKTLWLGDIEHWMDEPYIASLFAGTGAVVSVKVIRDKNSGLPAGYGFVEFQNHQVAQEVLQTFNGKMIPGTNKTFRLNWGVFGGGNKPGGGTGGGSSGTQSSTASTSQFGSMQQAQPQVQAQAKIGGAPGPEFSSAKIYVGELDSSVNDTVIVEFFSRKYKSVLGAKVIVDPVSKQSKGFGFVKFGNYEDSQSAIREMQGSLLRGRAIKTSQAYMKNASTDSATTNLNQMFNPLAALASSPFLMGMGGLGGFGGQGLQSFPSFPGGTLTPTLSQAYGSYQDPNAQLAAQPSMYGFPSFGGADQGYQQAYQGYAGYQGYGGYQQQAYGQNAAPGGFMGSFFDPTNAPGAQSTSPHQQTPYPGTNYGAYQMYGQTQTAQYPQAQSYGTVDYTQQQQQQQYMNYGQQQQQQPAQPAGTTYGTAQQGYQQTVNNVANPNEASATTNTVAVQPQATAETQQVQAQANEETESMKIEEEEDYEPIMLYNSACIENNFRYDFINSDKIKMIL